MSKHIDLDTENFTVRCLQEDVGVVIIITNPTTDKGVTQMYTLPNVEREVALPTEVFEAIQKRVADIRTARMMKLAEAMKRVRD